MVSPSSRGEREVNPLSHVSIVQSSPPGIRQGLVRLLDPNEPLGVLLDPTRGRHVRVVLPGQLLVRLLDVAQRSRFRYAQKLVEAELSGLGDEPIVDGGLGLDGPTRHNPGGEEDGFGEVGREEGRVGSRVELGQARGGEEKARVAPCKR